MSLTSKLIAKILVLCGISLTCTACYAPGNVTVYMTDIEGMVTDEATGQPIEGIKVTTGNPQYEYGGVMTDGSGDYAVKDWAFRSPPFTITITAEDIDGPENGGEYDKMVKEIELVDRNFKPKEGYDDYEAKAKIDFALTLKPQNTQENGSR